MLYKTTIQPVLDYGDIIYDACLRSESDAIEKFQRKATLVCSDAFNITSNGPSPKVRIRLAKNGKP